MKKLKLNIQLFAASLTTTSLTEVSYDTVANTSNVRYLVKVTTTGGTVNETGNMVVNYTINGTSYSEKKKMYRQSTSTLVDKTVTVQHNVDGTKTVSASMSTATGTSAGTLTDSQTLTLTPLPRATQCPTITATIGTSVNITLSPNDRANMSHKLVYIYNNQEYTIAELARNVVQTTWAITESTYAAYVGDTAISTQLPLKLYTYYNNNTWTSTSTATLNLDINSIKPSINDIEFVATDALTKTLTGDNTGKTIIATASAIVPNIDYTLYTNATLKNIYLATIELAPNNTLKKVGLIYINTDTRPIKFPLSNRYERTKMYDKFYSSIKDSRSDVVTSLGYPYINDYDLEVEALVGYKYWKEWNITDVCETYVPYEPLYYYDDKIVVSRPSSTSTQMSVGFALDWWNDNFGSVNNSLTVSYTVTNQAGTTSSSRAITNYVNVETESTNNVYQARTGTQSGYDTIYIDNPFETNGEWDYLQKYTINLTFADAINSRTFVKTVVPGLPIFDAWEDDGGQKYFNVNGKLLLNNDLANEVGTTLTTAATNAATALSTANTANGKADTNASNITALQNVRLQTISKQQNGYVKFANGFIVQWGYNKAGTAFNLPTSFTNTTSFSIVGNDTTQGASGVINIVVNSKSNVTIYCHVPNGAYYTDYVRWIAIGY